MKLIGIVIVGMYVSALCFAQPVRPAVNLNQLNPGSGTANQVPILTTTATGLQFRPGFINIANVIGAIVSTGACPAHQVAIATILSGVTCIQLDLSSTYVSGVLPVALGGSGTATPSLIPGAGVSISGSWPNQTISSSAAGTVTHTPGPLTLDQPMFGAGAADTKVGTKTGNTNQVVTAVPGTQLAGICTEWDINGNLVPSVSNAPCGSGGGGAGMFFNLGDFAVDNTSSAVQRMCALCTASAPGMIRQGAVTSVPLTAPVTATLSGTSVPGVNPAWWYFTSQLILTVGHNTASTITCPSPCAVATGITGFPPDSIPLWNTTFTSLAWNTVTPAMNKRASMSNTVIAPGNGVSSAYDPTTGIQTISTDPTITPRWSQQAGPPSSTCAAGRDFNLDTTAHALYDCTQTNVWTPRGGSTVTDVHTFPACAAQSSVPIGLWDVSPTSLPSPGPVLIGGGSNNPCALSFSTSGTNGSRIYHTLAPTWTGSVKLSFDTESLSGVAGVVNTLSVKTFCLGNNSDFFSPTFNAAQTVTFTSLANNHLQVTNSINNLTTTGCVGGNTLMIDITKTDTNAALQVMRAYIQDTH